MIYQRVTNYDKGSEEDWIYEEWFENECSYMSSRLSGLEGPRFGLFTAAHSLAVL